MKFTVSGLPEGIGPNPLPPSARSTSQIVTEGADLLTALADCNVPMPDNIRSASDLIQGIGHVFMPGEMPPADGIVGASRSTQQLFKTSIQPPLLKALRQGTDEGLNVGHHLGRLMGAAHELGLMNPSRSIVMKPDQLVTGGVSVPYSIEGGLVVEFGMGLNGLFSHLDNVRKKRYQVVGIHASKPEVTVLNGMREYNNIDANQLQITDAGIPKIVTLLGRAMPGKTDLVIASRAHPAGPDLKYGMSKVTTFMHNNGQIVARGPRRYPQGIGYDSVLHQLKNLPGIEITHDVEFREERPNNSYEPNRLIVARKVTR